ncbi:MAG: efflux RND transporter periplasmic adaptor subunit [Pseudomonadota bacterium]|nr:efflux RND transporter periplasmic adaptor subunit [Pseudomonadota bacterium]
MHKRQRRLTSTLAGILMFSTGLFNSSVVIAEEIKVETVQSVVYDRHVNLGGTVIPFKEVTITAQHPGQINYIAGIEGDAFNAGTLLISTDDDSLRAQRKAAVAQWNQASYAYQNAISQYNRELWSPASEKGMPGMGLPNLMDQMFTKQMSDSMGYGDSDVEKRADLTNAMSRVKEAQAMMQAAKAQIDEIDVRLYDTKSTAPFDGVIVEKMVEAGDSVQPGQPLLVFAKSNHLSIELNVPVSLMHGITKGQILKASIANRTAINVRVAQVFPVANGQQHTVKIKLDLPLGAPAAPGMYAEVSVSNAQSQNQAFPTVPASAIIKRGSMPTIFVYDPSTRLVNMKIIRTAKASNNGYLTVLSGLTDGEQFIANPPAKITSGLLLRNGQLVANKKSDDDE